MNGNFNVTPIKKDENVVTTDTAQTISGSKNFTGTLKVNNYDVLATNDIDSQPTLQSNNPVSSDGVYTALQAKVDKSVYGTGDNFTTIENDGDQILLEASEITTGGTPATKALQITKTRVTIDGYDVLTENEVDSTPTENSSNVVTSGGVYSAIQNAITTALNTPV